MIFTEGGFVAFTEGHPVLPKVTTLSLLPKVTTLSLLPKVALSLLPKGYNFVAFTEGLLIPFYRKDIIQFYFLLKYISNVLRLFSTRNRII